MTLVFAIFNIFSKAGHQLNLYLKNLDPLKAVASKKATPKSCFKSSFIEIKLFFCHVSQVFKKKGQLLHSFFLQGSIACYFLPEDPYCWSFTAARLSDMPLSALSSV